MARPVDAPRSGHPTGKASWEMSQPRVEAGSAAFYPFSRFSRLDEEEIGSSTEQRGPPAEDEPEEDREFCLGGRRPHCPTRVSVPSL